MNFDENLNSSKNTADKTCHAYLYFQEFFQLQIDVNHLQYILCVAISVMIMACQKRSLHIGAHTVKVSKKF